MPATRNNLLAKALAKLLHSGNQRVEAMFPRQIPDTFIGALVQQLDEEKGASEAQHPYAVWVRMEPAKDNCPIEQRHVVLSGGVVAYRNNHPRAFVYREGDYEPIAGFAGASASVMPLGFPEVESRQVTLRRIVVTAMEILATDNTGWNDLKVMLVEELVTVMERWWHVFDSLPGQELSGSEAWWRYAIRVLDDLAELSCAEVSDKGATWAACRAGRYPIRPGGSNATVSSSSWKELHKVIQGAFCDTQTANDALRRYEVANEAPHPAQSLSVKEIDLLTPKGPSEVSGNLGLVFGTLDDDRNSCWGTVTESDFSELISYQSGGNAILKYEKAGDYVDLPRIGSLRPVDLLPISEWTWSIEDGALVVDVDDLLLVLPRRSEGCSSCANGPMGSGTPGVQVSSRPVTGLSVAAEGAGSLSDEGLKVRISLRVSFKVNSKWKTGPYTLSVEVPPEHPAAGCLEQGYQLRLVLPVPWGVTAVYSQRSTAKATGDSRFREEDGTLVGDELGELSLEAKKAPVSAELLAYDAGDSPGDESPILDHGSERVEEWAGCWRLAGTGLPEGTCVEDPETSETILQVEVQEQDDRPFLPVIAALQDDLPSNLEFRKDEWGEHGLLVKIDRLLAKYLLEAREDPPHGLAQAVMQPGEEYRFAGSMTPRGSVLWPFHKDAAAEPIEFRAAGSGPSRQLLDTPEATVFRESLQALCVELRDAPSKGAPLMLARKQLRGLQEDTVRNYLESYKGMVDAARELGGGDLFWATHACSIILAKDSTGEPQVGATLLSPLHPVRLGWLYSCERVFEQLDSAQKDLAQIAEGWNFPAVAPAPSDEGLGQSAMMAIPLDPGPHQLFYGWSLMVRCKPFEDDVLRVPMGKFGGLRIPGGATSGISAGGVKTSLTNYVRSYPHLGSLVIELTCNEEGQRSPSLDSAVIREVQDIAKRKKSGVSSVKVFDDARRKGRPPSAEAMLSPASGGGLVAGEGLERFGWIRSGTKSSTEKVDVRFVEDSAAIFSVVEQEPEEELFGSAPAWPLRRFPRRQPVDSDSHRIWWNLKPLGGCANALQKAIHGAVIATEQSKHKKPLGFQVRARLERLLGREDSEANWVVIGNVGLDMATLSAISGRGGRLLWEWRPPFVDTSESRVTGGLDLSRRSFTSIASIEGLLSGPISNLDGVTAELASKVLEQLGKRGVGLASLMSIDDNHAEGALGFHLAYDILDHALSATRDRHPDEVDLILPLDAIDSFLRVMADAGQLEEDESRKKADLLAIRITKPGGQSVNWQMILIPVEVTCRGFTNDPKPSFPGPTQKGVKSKQEQLENSCKVLRAAKERIESDPGKKNEEETAALVSALGCVIEMGIMLGSGPDEESPDLDLPALVSSFSGDQVDISVHPGILLWFANLQESPCYEPWKLPPPGSPNEQPHRAFFVSPQLVGNGHWSGETLGALAKAIELDDVDADIPTAPSTPDPIVGGEGAEEKSADEGEIAIEDFIANEGMICTLSHRGYVKRTSASEYRLQGRGGKGVLGMETRGSNEDDDDFVEHLFSAQAHDYLMFFTNTGRVYVEGVYELPEGSRVSKGRSIKNVLNLQPEESIAAMLRLERRLDEEGEDVTFGEDAGFVLFATRTGKVKKTGLHDFRNFRKDGIIAIEIEEGNELIDVRLTNGSDEIVLVTSAGFSLRFREEQARPMGRTAAGVAGIKPVGNDVLVGLALVSDQRTLLVASENGIGKRTSFREYRAQTRGGKGIITMKVTGKTGQVVGAVAVEEDDELILMTTGGQSIRIRCSDVRKTGRNAQGVRLVALRGDEKLQDIAKVVAGEGDEEESEDSGGDAPPAVDQEGGGDHIGLESAGEASSQEQAGAEEEHAGDEQLDDLESPSGDSSQEEKWWSGMMNKFGLVGQIEAIEQIHAQINDAKVLGGQFRDQLFEGPPGVGKSTIARLLAERLGKRFLEVSGVVLKKTKDLTDLLKAQQLIGSREGDRVVIDPVVIFIDEVHAIGKPVHDFLLSATDDRREVSGEVIGEEATDYSFEETIFLFATTDPGVLSRPFVSRPVQVTLSAYSLEELSAIVLLHGNEAFGGYELPRDICIEIAARNRGNPRRSVRCLPLLRADALKRLQEDGWQHEDLSGEEKRLAVAQSMTHDSVCSYFDRLGTDRNGIDKISMKMLARMKDGAQPEAALMLGCGIMNKKDFNALWEFCERLGLVGNVSGGRGLTQLGHTYLLNPGSLDLRNKIV